MLVGGNLPSMRLWQLTDFTTLLNGKSSWSVTTLQILKSIDWNTRCTSGELQQTRLLFCIPRANNLPEMLNDLVILGVTTIISMLLPVFDIDIGDTTDQEFQFALVENVNKILWNELMETLNEVLELFFDSLLNTPFCNQSG
jgi:hypothetical protein